MSAVYIVRSFRSEDRDAVRRICCDTGFLGNPIDPVFRDRVLFADFLTTYYTDREPEMALVAEMDAQVVGYLLGCTRAGAYRFHMICLIARCLPRAVLRFVTGQYTAASRRYMWWVLTRGWRETPPMPAGAAHFHFNFLPEARGTGAAREAVIRWLAMLRAAGVHRVCGQMVVHPDRRSIALFEKLGWKVTAVRPWTKYNKLTQTACFMATIEKDLDEGNSDGTTGQTPSNLNP